MNSRTFKALSGKVQVVPADFWPQRYGAGPNSRNEFQYTPINQPELTSRSITDTRNSDIISQKYIVFT